MNTYVWTAVVVLAVPILAVFVYGFIMYKKQQTIPAVKLEYLKRNDLPGKVEEMEKLINGSIKENHGYLYLATVFTGLHYLLSIWSIAFAVLNLFVIKDPSFTLDHISLIMIFSILAMIASTLDLGINSKEKSLEFNKRWLDTSLESRRLVSDLTGLDNLKAVRERLNRYLDTIGEKTKDVKFL